MLYLLVSIKDRAIEAYQPIGNVRAEGEAIRVFKDMIADPNTPQNKHADDYDIYIVGTFDDQTGQIDPEIPPRKLADGKTIKETINQQ